MFLSLVDTIEEYGTYGSATPKENDPGAVLWRYQIAIASGHAWRIVLRWQDAFSAKSHEHYRA